MSSLHISGLGSGIDWRSIVDAMMDVERIPLERMSQRRSTLETQKSAWSGLRVSLSGVNKALDALRQPGLFSAKRAQVSQVEVLAVRVDAQASTGDYQVEVVHLAQSHAIASSRFAEPEVAGGWSGEFLLNGTAVVVEASDSLLDVAQKINEAGAAATAQVIDGTLVMRAAQSGEEHQLSLEQGGEDDILQALGLWGDEGELARELVAAQDARFTVGGLEIIRATNEVDDVLPGLRITLQAVGTTTISVRSDAEPALGAFKSWVEAYNSFVNRLGRESQEGGFIQSDATLLRIERSLRALVTFPILGGEGPYTCLEDIGITAGTRDALLQIDESKLQQALNTDPQAVQRLLFAPEDEGVGVGDRLSERITALASTPRGVISGHENELDRVMRGIDRHVERMTLRMERREQHLVRRFMAMEEALGLMQTQSEWMFQWASSQVNPNPRGRR